MKIPILIISLITPFIFFLVLRRSFEFFWSFIGTLIFAFNFQEIYYSLNGRGYNFMNLWLIIVVGCLFKLIFENEKNKILIFRIIFIGSSTLGFYTIPIFIFPFLGILFWYIIHLLSEKDYQKLYQFLMDIIIISILTFLLYLPVLLFNGFDVITNNDWVKSQEFYMYLNNFPKILNSVAGILFDDNRWSIYFYLIEIGILSGLIFIENDKSRLKWISLLLSIFLILIPILLIKRVTIYQRIFSYLWVFQSVFFIIISEKIYNLIKKYISFFILNISISVITAIFIIFNIATINSVVFPKDFDWYNSADKVSVFLYQKNAQQIFFNSYEMSLCTRFQYETNGKIISCSSHGNAPLKQNLYLVLEKLAPLYNTNSYNLIYKDPITSIYKLK